MARLRIADDWEEIHDDDTFSVVSVPVSDPDSDTVLVTGEERPASENQPPAAVAVQSTKEAPQQADTQDTGPLSETLAPEPLSIPARLLSRATAPPALPPSRYYGDNTVLSSHADHASSGNATDPDRTLPGGATDVVSDVPLPLPLPLFTPPTLTDNYAAFARSPVDPARVRPLQPTAVAYHPLRPQPDDQPLTAPRTNRTQVPPQQRQQQQPPLPTYSDPLEDLLRERIRDSYAADSAAAGSDTTGITAASVTGPAVAAAAAAGPSAALIVTAATPSSSFAAAAADAALADYTFSAGASDDDAADDPSALLCGLGLLESARSAVVHVTVEELAPIRPRWGDRLLELCARLGGQVEELEGVLGGHVRRALADRAARAAPSPTAPQIDPALQGWLFFVKEQLLALQAEAEEVARQSVCLLDAGAAAQEALDGPLDGLLQSIYETLADHASQMDAFLPVMVADQLERGPE